MTWDDMVQRAMVKWPHVPSCAGWLGFDARGRWFMRDEAAQGVSSFQAACATPALRAGKGEELAHEGLLRFIARNQGRDAEGRCFFQNGPQRVFVELECAPFVWRLDAHLTVTSTTGNTAKQVTECLVDGLGRLFLHTDLGLGLVHSLDVMAASMALDQGVWHVEEVAFESLPDRFGYVLSPQAST